MDGPLSPSIYEVPIPHAFKLPQMETFGQKDRVLPHRRDFWSEFSALLYHCRTNSTYSKLVLGYVPFVGKVRV
jgi:hypothetical protein